VWLWIINLSILLGAELNVELERGRAIAGGLPNAPSPTSNPAIPANSTPKSARNSATPNDSSPEPVPGA
jgi:hypothetical protein